MSASHRSSSTPSLAPVQAAQRDARRVYVLAIAWVVFFAALIALGVSWLLADQHEQTVLDEQAAAVLDVQTDYVELEGFTAPRSAVSEAQAEQLIADTQTQTEGASTGSASDTDSRAAGEAVLSAGQWQGHDAQLHTLGSLARGELNTGSVDDSSIWSVMRSAAGSPVPSASAMESAWACDDASADARLGQLSWNQAQRVSGAAVFIPSVCMVTPLVGTSTVSEDNTVQLQLPVPPLAAYYTASAPLGAPTGNSYIASHVNYYTATGALEWAPFKQVEAVTIGAPVLVRDAGENYYLYRASEQLVMKQTDALTDASMQEKLFRTDGAPTLSLVTCVRTANGWDSNRVLFAELVTD